MAEKAAATTEVDLSPAVLLAACQKELTPAELNLVRSQLGLLMDMRLVLPEGIMQFSAVELVGFGLLPGVAAALKRALPTPAGPAAGTLDKFDKKLGEVDKKLVELKTLQLKALSATRHASSITEEELTQVEGALHIWWATQGLDGLSDEASASLEDATEYTWDCNKHEAKHKEEYMQVFKNQVRLPGHLAWSGQVDRNDVLKTTPGTGGADLPFSIGCRTDALVTVRNAAVNIEGAVAATVELKKRVVRQSVLQAKTTWICASLKSHLPVLSVLTDMNKVFAAFYTEGQKDSAGRTVCIQHMFPDSASLMQFMHCAMAAVPSDVLRFSAGRESHLVLADELPNPKRVRLPVPKLSSHHLLQAAMRSLAEHAAGGSDVGRIDDLTAFDDQVAFKDVAKHHWYIS